MATVTWAHYAIIQGKKSNCIIALILTIILSLIFTAFQGFEYYYAPFTFADSVFGSVFYFGTGLILAPIKITNKFYSRTVLYDGSYGTNNNFIDPYWITRFLDGESCFTVKLSKNEYRWKIVHEFNI